jgi:hypothetical protein
MLTQTGGTLKGGDEFDVDTADWVHPSKIRDKQKRRPDDPNYDPRTCFVPPQAYAKMTPG